MKKKLADTGSLDALMKEHLPGIYFTGTYDGRYKLDSLDESCYQMLGYYSKDLLSGKIALTDLVHPDDRELISTNHRIQFEKGRPFVNEFRVVARSGEIKWVKEITSYKTRKNSKIAQISGYIQDITPFKTGVSVSNAYKSYQNAVNSGSLVSVTDKTGRIIFANELFCNASKFSKKELIGSNHNIVNSGFHDKAFFGKMWKEIVAGRIWRGQILNKAKDGSLYWVDTVISPIFDNKGKIEQFLSIRSVITEQKVAEFNLLESEEMNRSILDSMQAGIAIIDRSGEILRVNKILEELGAGVNRNNILKPKTGTSYFDLLDRSEKSGGEYISEIRRGIQSLLKSRRTVYEKEFQTKVNAETRWFLLHITRFEVSKEKLVLSYFDITQRKQQEEVVRLSRIQLMDAQRIAKIGSWELDLKSNKLEWSDETYRIFEKVPGKFKLSLQKFVDMVHPEDREYVSKAYDESLKKRTPYNIVHRILLSDGRIKYVNEQCETQYDNRNRPLRSLGTIQDITKLKESEIRLENQQIRYQNVVENISDALIIDDINGNVVFANKQFLKMIGIKEKDLKDFVFVDYVSPEYKEEILKRHRLRMRGKDVSNVFEYLGMRKDGTRRWFEARVTKIEHNGKIIGTQSAIRDITELKESIDRIKYSEAEKTNLITELNQRYNELMQFNYIVSHNLRAPIANIIGLTELFGMDDTDAEEKAQIMKHIQSSILKIDDLIKDLNIILATRSDINSKKEWVEFDDVMNRVCTTLDRQILEAEAVIDTDIEQGAEKIYSIKSYIKSCLYNLVNNAIKYRSPGVKPHIKVRISKDKSNFLIRVKDNGIGIDLKKYGKDIFGLYKRFHTSFEGKGIGLNMTRTQIEALGGSIKIESSPGNGSEFTIILPVSTPAAVNGNNHGSGK